MKENRLTYIRYRSHAAIDMVSLFANEDGLTTEEIQNAVDILENNGNYVGFYYYLRGCMVP